MRNLNYIEYIQEGERVTKTFPDGAAAEEVFTAAAKMICFADCSDIDVERVVVAGEEYTYAGWQHGMRFTFLGKNGEIAWDRFFPEWDH